MTVSLPKTDRWDVSARDRSSEWTRIPERLYLKHDPLLPRHLYAKATLQHVIAAAGRKPRDVPSDVTTAQMLIHQQRWANQKVTAP